MELKYYVIDLTEGSFRLESQSPWNRISGIMLCANSPHPTSGSCFSIPTERKEPNCWDIIGSNEVHHVL